MSAITQAIYTNRTIGPNYGYDSTAVKLTGVWGSFTLDLNIVCGPVPPTPGTRLVIYYLISQQNLGVTPSTIGLIPSGQAQIVLQGHPSETIVKSFQLPYPRNDPSCVYLYVWSSNEQCSVPFTLSALASYIPINDLSIITQVNGKIGINNSNPAYTLDVSDPASDHSVIGNSTSDLYIKAGYLGLGSIGSYAALEGDGVGITTYSGDLNISSAYGNTIIESTNNIILNANTSGSYTGIGINNGLPQYTLDVSDPSGGTATIGNSGAGLSIKAGYLSVGGVGNYLDLSADVISMSAYNSAINISANNDSLSLTSAYDITLYPNTSGEFVGVGINTNPSYTFDVYGDINYSGTLYHNGTPVSIGGGGGGSYADIYDVSGQVGINNASPSHTLDVTGTIYASSKITCNSLDLRYNGTFTGRIFPAFGGGSYALNTNVGSDCNLTVQPHITLTDGIAFAAVNDANTANNSMEFRASKYMFWANNVGIDVSNPSEKLDVSGFIKATGYKSSDGSTGLTTTINYRKDSGTTLGVITVKNGLITSVT